MSQTAPASTPAEVTSQSAPAASAPAPAGSPAPPPAVSPVASPAPGTTSSQIVTHYVDEDKRVENFINGPPPSEIVVSVEKSEATDRGGVPRVGGTPEQGSFFIAMATGIGRAYANILGVEKWRVTQLPLDRRYRWNSMVRTPPWKVEPKPGETPAELQKRQKQAEEEMRKQAAKKLLDAINWKDKQKTQSVTGYRFFTAPADQTTSDVPDVEEGMYVTQMSMPIPLQGVLNLGRQQGTVPFVAEKDVLDKMPARSLAGGLKVPRGNDPEKFAQFVSAVYRVGYKKEPIELVDYLVYHPSIQETDIAKWERGEALTGAAPQPGAVPPPPAAMAPTEPGASASTEPASAAPSAPKQ